MCGRRICGSLRNGGRSRRNGAYNGINTFWFLRLRCRRGFGFGSGRRCRLRRGDGRIKRFTPVLYGPVIIFYFPFGIILGIGLLVFGDGLFGANVCVKN